MPRGVYDRKNVSRRWTPERRARQMATIRAKHGEPVKVVAATTVGISTIVDTELIRLNKEIERLQKVRDLLR